MCEVNCTNCRVSAFKHGLCPDDFCEKHKALGTEDDFIRTLQRKPGKWIPQDYNRRNGYVTTAVYYYPKCSECGYSGDYNMNYCPNCGAKMEGG